MMSNGMAVTMGLVAIGALCAIGIGIVLCAFKSYRSRGKQLAFYGTAAFIFVFSFAAFQGKPDSKREATTVTQANATPAVLAAKPLTYAEILSQVRVSSFSWRKSSFGMTMTANFVVHNDSSVPIKDVVVTCVHAANSGTKIDSNTRTVYEIVGSRSYLSVVEMDMGFIHSKVSESSCKVIGFTRA